jgi:hypothetical protein
MDFKSKAHQKVYKEAKKYLHDVFGEMIHVIPERPTFILERGNGLTRIIVLPWSDDDAIVCSRAYVTFGSDLQPDLLLFLLNQKTKTLFGAFGVDDDGDIFFEHTIAGSNLDKDELKASALAVASTADKFDEQIVERWGGITEKEKIKQM